MTAYLDTNVVIRHLTGDPPDQARRATAHLSASTGLVLTDVVAAETVYVLESFYRRPSDEIASVLRSVVAFDGIEAERPERILRAVELYEVHGIDFADAYLAACAENDTTAHVVSFDRDLDAVPCVTRIEP